ncbi:hypothetical protein JIG36_25105 [Actinoplanes sp. LDG1-06]|uniref:Uncharacterized protein n=1 Tax=Paractinoplanes ovalisporus TaxID=2810368 RepID=A0ABS2AG89_9ACTN|nr:hypothetical protein [Actinoplanes ovalisporus]MBM2618841.1 hypothetical protein [Actinoplanes ovalisporus]
MGCDATGLTAVAAAIVGWGIFRIRDAATRALYDGWACPLPTERWRTFAHESSTADRVRNAARPLSFSA